MKAQRRTIRVRATHECATDTLGTLERTKGKAMNDIKNDFTEIETRTGKKLDNQQGLITSDTARSIVTVSFSDVASSMMISRRLFDNRESSFAASPFSAAVLRFNDADTLCLTTSAIISLCFFTDEVQASGRLNDNFSPRSA